MLLQTRSANEIIRYKQRIQAKKPGKMGFFAMPVQTRPANGINHYKQRVRPKKVSVFSPRTKESSQWNRYLFAESTDRTIDS